jgi:hypothetical protein
MTKREIGSWKKLEKPNCCGASMTCSEGQKVVAAVQRPVWIWWCWDGYPSLTQAKQALYHWTMPCPWHLHELFFVDSPLSQHCWVLCFFFPFLDAGNGPRLLCLLGKLSTTAPRWILEPSSRSLADFAPRVGMSRAHILSHSCNV